MPTVNRSPGARFLSNDTPACLNESPGVLVGVGRALSLGWRGVNGILRVPYGEVERGRTVITESQLVLELAIRQEEPDGEERLVGGQRERTRGG